MNTTNPKEALLKAWLAQAERDLMANDTWRAEHGLPAVGEQYLPPKASS